MHKLHKIIKQIHKELDAAEDYIHCSSASEDENVRDTYKSIARDELTHADKLMSMCDKHIKEDLKAFWEFEKDMFKERYMDLKTKLSYLM